MIEQGSEFFLLNALTDITEVFLLMVQQTLSSLRHIDVDFELS